MNDPGSGTPLARRLQFLAYQSLQEATMKVRHLFNSLGPFVRSPTMEHAALVFCLIVGLVPIWAVERFPSVDGPMHLYVVHILEQLLQPGTNAYDRLFEINPYLEPNTTIYALLLGLVQVVPPLTAEKIFVSSYWLLFAGSAWYALRAWGRDAGIFVFLLLPFALGYFLHWGFYNFILSQALFLLAIGYASRHLDHLRLKQLMVLALLMLVLAVTHLVGIAMFLFFLGLVRSGIALRDGLGAGSREAWRPILLRWARDAVLLFVAALPALAVVVSFLLRRVLGDEGAAPDLSLMQKIFYVASISPIFALDTREAFALLPFTVMLWGSAAWLLWHIWKQPTLRLTVIPPAVPVVVLGVFVVLGSLGFAGFEGLPRLLPFFFFMLVFAFGTITVGAAWRGAILVAVCGGLLATSILHLSFYRQANAMYDAFVEARPAPPAGSAILAFNTGLDQRLVAGYPTGWRVNISEHFRTNYAREHGLFMLNLVHLSPQVYGYFPVSFRSDVNVAAAISARDFQPPAAPLDHFERTTGIEIREVSFWPHLEPEPHVDFNLDEREPILRRELAREWRQLPRTSNVDHFIYVERDGTGQDDGSRRRASRVLGQDEDAGG
jgi:hypothetical protein